MASLNKKIKAEPIFTHGGAKASRNNNVEQLRRQVMTCLLWENSFYETGSEIAKSIQESVKKLTGEEVAQVAREARTKFKLRHVPLFLARELARGTEEQRLVVADLLGDVIQRPDELTEYLAMYWKDGRQKVSAQSKKGLAKAFTKFNEYNLAKYNKDGVVKLRDVLFLSHAKPTSVEQADLWNRLVKGELETPDTWETQLSAGKDKKETFERLISEGKLGALALLRNLRNMQQAGVDELLVKDAIKNMNVERILPFRFLSAAKYAPSLEPVLEEAMLKCLQFQPKLRGKTVLLVDASGSMKDVVSANSELSRFDTAAALAIMLREICDDCEVYAFSSNPRLVPARRGFGLKDALIKVAEFGGTNTEDAKKQADKAGYDRLIILTDEQSHQRLSEPKTDKCYIVNVAAYKNGIGYGKWHQIDGWSESIIDYIQAVEEENA